MRTVSSTVGSSTFTGWNLLQSPFLVLLAAVYLLAALAECQRTPFDMAEAESELVAGFSTEYSGLRWGMFAMAEYTEIILSGCLFSVFFLKFAAKCEKRLRGIHIVGPVFVALRVPDHIERIDDNRCSSICFQIGRAHV